MFESAMGRYEAAENRPLTGAILSIGAHALVIAAVIFIPGKKVLQKDEAPEVVFQVPVQKPALLGSPAPAKAAPQTAPKRPRRTQVPIPPKDPPPTTAPPVDEPKEPDPPAGGSEGQTAPDGTGNGGDPDGVPDGEIGGKGKGPPPPPEPPPQNQVLAFTAEMTRPSLASGPSQPDYPREALVARVEGVAVVKCTITAEGLARDCTILKSPPYLDGAIQAMLAKQRYKPATYGGRPVSVRYSFTYNFKLH